jgi:hypothetical protein
MAELAGIDLDGWRGLNADQRKMADQQTTVFANAAMDVLQRPPEQRAAAWDAYIDQFAGSAPDLLKYKGQYNEQTARAVIAQSDMITKLHEMEQPRYQAIPEGGTLVDTRNPQAVQQFAQSAAQPQAKQIGGKTYIQDANGDWFEDDGGPTQPASATFRP